MRRMGKRGCVGESKHLIELRPLGRLEVGGQELELLWARRALAQPGEVLELEHALVEAEQRLLDRNAFELLERDLNLRKKNQNREFISDIWGERGATYGEMGCVGELKNPD